MGAKVETIVTILRILVLCFLALISLATGIIAYIRGKNNSRLTKSLSESEQREDLRKYMIEEIESAESTAKMFQTSNTADWKKMTVLKNVTLYAKGQGYGWYDKDEWSENIDNYVKGTKLVNFTKVL